MTSTAKRTLAMHELRDTTARKKMAIHSTNQRTSIAEV